MGNYINKTDQIIRTRYDIEYIGCGTGDLLEFDTSENKVINKYIKYHKILFVSSLVTPDNLFLFTSDIKGY